MNIVIPMAGRSSSFSDEGVDTPKPYIMIKDKPMVQLAYESLNLDEYADNVIFVAAFCPVIEELSTRVKDMPLWWALLFGACFGGNITMIGSTANIVALGMLEKRSRIQMGFMQWLKIGFISALLAFVTNKASCFLCCGVFL